MRIGLVGGVERNEGQYRELAEAAGHQLGFHSGHTGGRGSSNLAEMVRGAGLVVIVTDVNSHGAVQLARRLARRNHVPAVLLRRCSPSRFATLIEALSSIKTQPPSEASMLAQLSH